MNLRKLNSKPINKDRLTKPELESITDRVGAFEVEDGAFVQDPDTGAHYDGIFFQKIYLALLELAALRKASDEAFKRELERTLNNANMDR